MLLTFNTMGDFTLANNMATDTTTLSTKKKKTKLQIAHVKVKLFFWNLSPIHWYDTFKDIHIDMNEFVSPKKNN